MEPDSAGQDYVHKELNQEISSISGYYVLMEEFRLPFQNRSVLYATGFAVIDNSCCGAASFSYAIVPGFVLNWKYKKNNEGFFVTQVEPIGNLTVQNEIKKIIMVKETLHQINFM
jgi:hypothetical protein